MILEEYNIENTKIKIHNDCMPEDLTTNKEYMDNIIINLIKNSYCSNK